MFIVANLISSAAYIVNVILTVYYWLIIIRALICWVNPDPFNPIVQFLYRITNPAYALVKKFIRTDFNGLDLAPLAIIVGLQVLIILLNLLFSVVAKIL